MKFSDYRNAGGNAAKSWFAYKSVASLAGYKVVSSVDFLAGYNAAMNEMKKIIAETKNEFELL